MDADRFFLRLAAERGLVAPALAQECAARAAPGDAARMLVERARIPSEVARGLMAEAQQLAVSGSAALRASLIDTRGPAMLAAPAPPAAGVAPTERHEPQGTTWAAVPASPGLMGRLGSGGGPGSGGTPPGSSRPGSLSGGAGAGLQPGAMFGRYRLEAELGRGGMGVVWRARQTDLDRDVALKLLPPGGPADERARQRFAAEARAVARLSHPHIVAVHDVGELDGVLYFTMEYVDGGSLESVPLGQPLPADRVIEIGIALADALECAHQAGIVHRDLKPGNVLLTRNGTPRLTDFGIAKHQEGGSLTQSGEILGTPAYMSPEQADGQRTGIDGRTDIYAAGAILYRLLTGHPPFEAPTPYEVLRKVLTSAVVPPRRVVAEVPRPLELVVLRCLEKEREKRYASAGELGEALRRLRDQLPAGGAEPRARTNGFGPPRWFWAVLGLGLLLLAGTGAGVLAWRHHETTSQAAALLAAQEEARREEAQRAAEAALRAARGARESAGIEPAAALAQAEKAARDAPDVAEVQAILGLLLLDVRGDAQAALPALERALALAAAEPSPGGPAPSLAQPLLITARAARGRCLIRLSRDPALVQAEADGLDGLGQLGKAAAAELLGELAHRDGKTALAVTKLSDAVRLLPDDARLHRRLARAHLDHGKPERALAELEVARRLEPDSIDERILRGAALLQLGQAEEARQEIQAALKRDPDRPEAREVMARIERQTRRPSQPPAQPGARDGGDHGTSGEPHERVHQTLKEGLAAASRRDGREALRAFEAAWQERESSCPGLLHDRSSLARALGKWQEARQDLARLVKREEKVQWLLELAEVEVELKRGAEATQLIQRALQLEPRSPAPLVFLARIHEQLKRPAEAEKAWAAVLERAPQDAELIHERGHFLDRQGRREEALVDLDRALELKPGHGHYLVVRGELLLGLGRSDEARQALELALRGKLSPADEKHARDAMARLPAQSEQPR